MYEDFDGEYEKEDEETLIEKGQRIGNDVKDKIDKGKKIKNKIDKYKSKNDPTQVNEAKKFDQALRDKNIARSTNPEMAAKTAGNAAKAGGAGTTTGATAGVASGSSAGATATATTGATTAASTGATTGAATVGATTATTAGTTAATAGATTAGATAATAGAVGATGGAVAAQVAIPVAGWIALAVEAIIAAMVMAVKMRKKHDKKMAENGVDSKGLRRLLRVSPFLIPFGIIMLILIILVQAETYDKADFLKLAIECAEKDGGCDDFLNTGVKINGDGDPMIKKTDLEVAEFVVKYMFAEHKYFGNEGSSILDIVGEIDTIAREGLDEYNNKSVVEVLFEELVENTIIGDVRLAWNLFKWLRVEKKVFNNINWYKAYNASSFSLFSEWGAKIGVRLTGEPTVMMNDTIEKSAIALPSDLRLDTAFLKKPTEIGLDEAIELVRPYLPSWVELYATYIATGDFELCNDLYNYYIDENNYEIEVTLYQLITLRSTEKIEGESITSYYVKKDSETKELSKEEYELEISKGERGFFSWLGDKLRDLADMALNLLQELLEKVAKLLGFYVSTDSYYVPVVTKGDAYYYKVEKEYDIKTNFTEEYLENQEQKKIMSERTTITYEDGEDEKEAKFYVDTKVTIDYNVKTWANTLNFVSENKIDYEEDNRYEQLFVDMVKENDYHFTIDDVAMAIEVINSYYEEEYQLNGNNSANVQNLPEGGFAWPVMFSDANPESASLYRFYGMILPNGTSNNGIDIFTGNVSSAHPDIDDLKMGEFVVATHDGTVSRVQPVTDVENMAYIEITTEDGDYVTKYCNLSEIYVSEGDAVTKNTKIGRIGNTGTFDTDTELYLHYEVYYKGQATDPLNYYNITCNGEKVENYDELDITTITNPKEYKYESSKTYLGGSGEVVEFAAQYLGKTLSEMCSIRGESFANEWCAWFATWCLRECGIDVLECSNTNYCPTIWDNTTGVKHPYNGEPYTPKPGDIVLFCYPGQRYSHIAIVSKVENGVVYWIGGNQGTEGHYSRRHVTETCYDDRLKSYIEIN